MKNDCHFFASTISKVTNVKLEKNLVYQRTNENIQLIVIPVAAASFSCSCVNTNRVSRLSTVPINVYTILDLLAVVFSVCLSWFSRFT